MASAIAIYQFVKGPKEQPSKVNRPAAHLKPRTEPADYTTEGQNAPVSVTDLPGDIITFD